MTTRMRTTLAAAAALAAVNAHAVTITDFTYDPAWFGGISVAFAGADVINEAEVTFGQAAAFISGDTSPLTVGLVDAGGLDLAYGFDTSTGENTFYQAIVPPGWVVDTAFNYDPQTFSGMISWAFVFEPVPETGLTGGLLAVGLLGLALAGRAGRGRVS